MSRLFTQHKEPRSLLCEHRGSTYRGMKEGAGYLVKFVGGDGLEHRGVAKHKEQYPEIQRVGKLLIHVLDASGKPIIKSDGKETTILKASDACTIIGFVD